MKCPGQSWGCMVCLSITRSDTRALDPDSSLLERIGKQRKGWEGELARVCVAAVVSGRPGEEPERERAE